MRCKGFGLVQRKILKSAWNPSALSCLLSRLQTRIFDSSSQVYQAWNMQRCSRLKKKTTTEEGRLTYALTLSEMLSNLCVSAPEFSGQANDFVVVVYKHD